MKNRLLIAILICTGSMAISQDTLPIDDIEVIREYEASLKESKAILTAPKLIDTPSIPINGEYDINTDEISIDYPPPYIRPIGMRPEKNSEYYHGYIHGLYGTLSNPMVHAAYDVHTKDYFNMGVALHYESFEDSEVSDKNYRHASGQLRANYFLTENTLIQAKLSYDRESVFFFGLQDSIYAELSEAIRGQRDISQFQLESRAEHKLSDRFSAEAGFNYGLISSADTDISENHVEAFGQVEYQLTSALTSRLKAGVDYTFINQGIDNSLYNHLYIEPAVSLTKKKYSISASAAFLNNTEQTFILPDGRIKVAVSDQIDLSFATESTLIKHSLENMLNINPWYNQAFGTSINAREQDFSLTASYHTPGKLSIKAQAGYTMMKDHYFFLNDYFTSYVFNDIEVSSGDRPLQYTKIVDDATDLYMRIEASYPVHPAVELLVEAQKHFISVDQIQEAWHTSSFQASLGAKAGLFKQRLFSEIQFHVQEGVPYIDLFGTNQITGYQYDLSIDIKAKLMERVMFNFQAMNLLNSEYQRWNGYANFGLHLNGGLIIKL